jgi:hypothetical protein
MTDQRRGKIARLPRSIRDQLNVRLDDGQDADQILPWLNDLPEVREVLAKHFNGANISPQNLSGWRQGGFQEWLLHRQYLDSAIHMTEHVERLDNEFSTNPYGTYRTLADYMITQISIRMAGALVRWKNDGANVEMNMLLKLGQFVIKLQKAAHLAERQALELPRLRRKVEEEELQHREALKAFIAHCYENVDENGNIPSPWEVERKKAKEAAAQKPPVRSTRPEAQSKPVKVDKASRPNQAERPESTEPPVVEYVPTTTADQTVPIPPVAPKAPSPAAVRHENALTT